MNLFDGIEEASAQTRRGPVSSLEFRRVRDLPRRVWDQAPDLDDLVEGLTAMLRVPGGTMTLKRPQAAALRDIHDHGGMFGPICVGGGKTLISLLAPVLLKAKRPVLLVPASLRDQTRRVIPEMARHWRLHPNLQIFSYTEISLEKNADLLARIRPDMLIADECQMLRNPTSGRTRRVSRHMSAFPDTVFVPLSGSMANHSILHYWHIIQWALKPHNAPMPTTLHEAREWALALDERVHPKDRLGPGALRTLCEPGETARQGYRRRLVETPGVVATGENELGVGLRIFGRDRLQVPARVQKMLDTMEETWETPGGDVIMEAVHLWAIKRQLVCGFYYQWWNQEGFDTCLSKSSLPQPLKNVVPTTGSGTVWEGALEILKSEGPTSSLGICKSDTASRSKRMKACLESLTGRATFAERRDPGASRSVEEEVEAVSSLITTMKQAGSVDFSAPHATEDSVFWAMMSQAYPELLRTLEGAVEAAKPPREWLDARKAWNQYVRRRLQYNRKRLDTPLQVWNEAAALHRKRAGSAPHEWYAWRAVKDTFKPNVVTRWVDGYMVEFARKWLEDGPGICWVSHEALGRAIDPSYFGAGDSSIADASGPIVASIQAHGTGKNLQRWDRNLVLCPPTAGGAWEQLLGRTHRMGQKSHTVTFEVLQHHEVFRGSMEQAFADARFLEDSLGNRQRLLYCDTDMAMRDE